MKYLLTTLFVSAAVLYVFAGTDNTADESAEKDVTVSIVLDCKTARLLVSVRNTSGNSLSMHMKTVEHIQEVWNVTGIQANGNGEKKDNPVFRAALEKTESAQNVPKLPDRSLVCNPGEGIGYSIYIYETSFWKDVIENGLSRCDEFRVLSKPEIFVPDSEGNPVKKDLSVSFEPVLLKKQDILKIEGERLEKELRTPFLPPELNKEQDGSDKEIIYTPTPQKKAFIGAYLNGKTGLVLFTARIIGKNPVCVHMKTLRKPETNMEVIGTDTPEENEPYNEWYRFSRRYSFRPSLHKGPVPDRTVILRPGEMIVNSIRIWDTDFWDDMLKTGIGEEKKDWFQFRLLTAFHVADQNGVRKVDDAEYDFNSAASDSKTLLRFEELRKKLHPDNKQDEPKDAGTSE